MPCCVPNCSSISSVREWTAEFPVDEQLLERWRAAIHAGTGQYLLDDVVLGGAQICNLHFEVEALEPSLFVRDNVQFKVASCRLCLRYGTVDSMSNMEDCCLQGQSLRKMANKYFRQSMQRSIEKQYFCERCTVRIDMTHAFWIEIDEAADEYRNLVCKLSEDNVLVKSTCLDYSANCLDSLPSQMQKMSRMDHGDIKEEPALSADLSQNERFDVKPVQLVEVIVKEEPTFLQSEYYQQPTESDEYRTVGGTIEPEEQYWICYVCNTLLENEISLINHLETEHKDLTIFSCEMCDLTFDCITFLNDHLMTHQPGMPKNLKSSFTCSACPLSFNRKYRRRQHEIDEHRIDHKLRARQNLAATPAKIMNRAAKSFTCSFCESSFRSERFLRGHIASKHNRGAVPIEKPVKTHRSGGKLSHATCNVCQAMFGDWNEIATHFKEAHPEVELQLFPCRHCEEVFTSLRSANYHQESRHTAKYTCDQCGLRLFQKQSLDKHRYTEHGLGAARPKKQFCCKFCNKSWSRPEYLGRHMVKHNVVNPYECSDCGMILTTNASRYRHINTGCTKKIK